MENVGQQDGEQTLSELHEREVLSFQTSLEHQKAVSTAIVAEAGKGFAKAKIYDSIAYLLQVATILGGIAGIRELIKWW